MEKKQYKKLLENALKFHKLIGASENYKRVKILLEEELKKSLGAENE